MSIYISWEAPDDSCHEDGCAIYVETEPGLIEFSGDECDCGLPNAPIIYQGSNVIPSNTDPREGRVDIASIPAHILQDPDDENESFGPLPWLRFGVNSELVILDVRGVETIVSSLTEWLKAVKDQEAA